MAYRPRRPMIIQAIANARTTEKGRQMITTEALTGVSADAAFLVLRKTELLRDKIRPRPQGRALRALVTRAAISAGFPRDRGYAYELVLMAYYRMLKKYKSTVLKARQARVEKRTETKPIASEFVLIG